jgi:hypothetical protein
MPKSISQLTTSPTLQEKMDASPSKLDFFGAMTDLTIAQQDNFNPGSFFATMYQNQEEKGTQPILFDKETLQKKYDYLYRGNKELFENDYKIIKDYYDLYQKGNYDKSANKNAPVNAVSALGVQNMQKALVLYSENNPYYDLTDTQWGKEYSPLMTTEQMADLNPFITKKGEELKPTLWDKLSTTWVLQEVDPETNLPLDKPYWKEQSAYDEVYNKKIRSIWGPQEQYGSAVANSLGSFLSALIPETIESVGTIAKIWPTPLQDTFNKISPVLKDKKQLDFINTPDQYTNALISFANRLKYKPSEEAVNAGWFGSVEGFFTQFGAGLAYILPQRGIAVVGAKLLANAGLKIAASKGLTGDAAKAFANNYVSKNVGALTTSTSLVGTGQMMGMNYRAAREAGLSKDDAALMTWAASPMIFLTEKLISSPYLIKGLVQHGPDLKKVIVKEITHELQQTGGKMTEQAALNIATRSSKWLIDKVGQGGKFLIKSPVTEGAVREGTQESLEEAGYAAMENIYDIGFADKDAVKGKGKYGTEFFSEETLNRIGESFIGGAILGGFMDAMSGGFKRKEQDDTFATIFASNKENDLRKVIEDAYKKRNLGYSHLDSSGSVMDYSSSKSGNVKSHNDLVYDTLMQKFNLYKSIKEDLGINSASFMEKVEGDVSIVKEALNNGLQQKEISAELEEKEKQLAEAKSTGSETKGLEEDIKKLHANLSGLKSSFDDILSGKRISDKTKQNLISNFYEGNKDYIKSMFAPVLAATQVDEFSKKLSEDKKLYKEALIQEKAKGVEVRNTYDDSIKALEDSNPEQLDANFFTALSNLRTQIDKYGIDSGKAKKLLDVLETKKAELLKSAESIFEAEELKAMQQSSMIDEAIDEEAYISSITQGLQQKNKMDLATNLSNLFSQDFLPSQKTIEEAEKAFEENENAFVNEYYTSYVPSGQESSYSINKVLDDIIMRVINGQETDTDIKTIEEIKQATGTKAIIASLQNNIYNKLPEKYVLLPKDGLPTLEQAKQLSESFGEIYNKIQFLEMAIGQNKLDRQNRQARIKANDVAIRFKLAEMIHPNITDEKVSSALNSVLDQIREDRQKMVASIKDNKFDDELISRVYSGVVQAESIIHSELNSDPELMKRSLIYAKGTWNLEAISGGYENPIEFKSKSFDSLYDHAFFDSVGSLRNPSDKVFATLVFINNLLTLQRGNPYDFYIRYEKLLSVIKSGDSIPSYEQQQLIRHIDSFLQDSDNSFIKEAKNIIRPKSKDASTKFYLNNSLFVRGYAGTGKTQMIAKSAAEMMGIRLRRRINVAIVAPGINLAANVAASVSRATGESKTYTLEDFISKGEKALDGIDLLIIDEASMISEEQLEQLDKIINGEYSVPAIMMGDQSQMPPMNEKQFTDSFVHVAVENVMERTLPITEIYRTGVDSIWNIQSALRNSMFSENRLISWPITTYNEERTQGVEYIDSNNPEEILSIFKNDFSEPSRRASTALIFLTKQERADAINKLMQDTDFVSRVSAEAINNSVFHMEGGVGSVLGHEFDNVYVGFSQTEKNKNIYSRAMLTAVTRAKSYVALLNTEGRSRIGEVLRAKDLSSEEKSEQKTKETNEIAFIVKPHKLTRTFDLKKEYADFREKVLSLKKGQQIVLTTVGTVSFPELEGLVGTIGGFKEERTYLNERGYEKEYYVDSDTNTDFVVFKVEGNPDLDRIVHVSQIEVYNKKKSEKKSQEKKKAGKRTAAAKKTSAKKRTGKKTQPAPDVNPPRDYNWKYSEGMGILRGDLYIDKLSEEEVVEPVNVYRQDEITYVEMSNGHSEPLNSFWKRYERTSVRKSMPKSPADYTFFAKKYNSSAEKLMYVNTFASAESGKQTENAHSKIKLALLSQIAQSTKSKYARKEKANIYYYKKYSLNTGTELKEFNNVLVLRYPDIKHVVAVAKSIGINVTEQQAVANGYDILGVLHTHQTSADLSKPSADNLPVEYNEALANKYLEKVKSGFEGHENAAALMDYNFALIKLRSIGSSHPEGFVGQVTMSEFGSGTLISKTGTANDYQPMSSLIKDLRAKGFYVSDFVYMDTQAYKTSSGENRPAMILEVSAGKGLPVTRVFVDSPYLYENKEEIKNIQRQLQEMKKQSGLNKQDIESSRAYKTLNFNRSLLHTNGKFHIPALENYLRVRDNIFINTKASKDDIAGQLNALIKAFDIISAEIERANPRATRLYAVAFKENSSKGLSQYKITEESAKKLKTRITDVYYPQLYVSLASIFKNKTSDIQGDSASEKKDNLIRSLLANMKNNMKDDINRAKSKPSMSDEEVRESREKVIQYYKRVLGSDFLSRRLEFAPRVTLNGKELYGLVKMGKVILEETKDGIEIGTKRHEAIHIILNYVLDEDSKNKILNAVKQVIAAERGGISVLSITDEVADEWLANKYETEYEDPKTLIGKFLHWLRRVFRGLKTHGSVIDELLYNIEFGKYKDEEFSDSDADITRTKEKEDYEEYSDEESEQERGYLKKKHKFTKKGKGLSSIGKLTGLQAKEFGKKKQFKYADYNNLKSFFGSADAVNIARKNVAEVLLKSSNYNGNIEDEPKTIKETINSVLNIFEENAKSMNISVNITTDDGQKLNTFNDINETNLHYLDSDRQMEYFYWRMGNKNILLRLIQKTFPSINIYKLINSDESAPIVQENDEFVDMTLEDQLFMFHENTIREGVETRNFTDTVSPFVKWNLETLRLKDGSFVNIVKMHKILVDGFSRAKQPSLTSLRESLEDIMGNTTTESDVKEHIEAFINKFLNTNIEVEDKSNFSHAYLEGNYKEISNHYPEFVASIGAKAQYSSSLLNAIVYAYGSVVPKPYVKWRITTGINSEAIFPSVNDSDDWKNRISEMLSTSFEFNDAGVQLSESFVSTIKGEDKKYDISEKGISHVDGTPIITFITKGGALNSVVMAPGVTARDIKMLMNNIGVKISLPAIKTFLFGTENTSLLGDRNYSYTPNRLAEIVAAWYLSSVNLLAKQEGATSFAGPFISQYYTKMGINPTSLNEAVKTDEGIEISDEAKTEELVIKPQDFFVLNRNLAKAQAYATGNGNIRYYFGVDGRKIYIDTPSGTAYNYFRTSGDGERASDYLKENPQDVLQGNPALIRQGVILNPYLDINSPMSVISMNIADGIENGNLGKKIGKMTKKDYIAVSVNSFINSAITSFNKSEQLQIPGQNISDKNKQYVWNVRFASSDEPNSKFIIRQGDKIFLNTSIVSTNISKIFIYHENSRDLSLQKWFNFLSSIPRVNISESDLEVWKENPEQLNGILANLSKNLPGFKKMVEKSGLVLTKDFLLSPDGTTVAAGKATIFNIDDIFNLNNYRKLKESSDKMATIRELFEERFMNMASFFSSAGYQHVPAHLELAGFDSFESYYKRNEDGSVSLNPFFEGFMYAYMINNHFTTQIIQGDNTLFTDLPDFFKRAAGPDAPMQKFRTDSKFGIAKTSLVAIVNDTYETNHEVVEILKKQSVDEALALKIATVKTQDGLGLLNPIMQELLKKSSGAEAGGMGNGMYKPVYFKQGLYFKYALLPLTAQTMENSPLAKSYFDKMFLSEDLRNKFYEYVAQEGFDFAVRKTAYDIAVSGRQNEIIGQVVFKSSVKSGASKINDLEDESWETVEIDNDFFGLQLNPEQDINDTEVALFTQILAQTGIGQSGAKQLERIKNINETQKTIAAIQTKSIFDDIISQEGRNNREKFFAYLKKMGLKASEQMGEVGQIVDMLNNRSITPDLPILRTKLIQMFGNKITKNAIKPPMNGVRMNQAPAFLFDIFDYQGQIMMRKDLRAIGLDDKQIDALPKRGLKPNEIIIPFSYVAQFGINPNMSVQQAREFIAANSPEKLQTFEKLLNVIFARTPSSAPSGAGLGRVVGWINDNSNTIYISSAKNVLDGSDFDIDQLSVYFNYVDEQGNLPALGTIEFYQNKLLGLVMDYYNDPENYEITHTPTSLSEIKDFLKQKEERDPSLKRIKSLFGKFNDFSSNAYMYEQIHSGKDIVGIAANANKAYSFLNHAINVNNFRSKEQKISNMISGFEMSANGKTDTGKFVIQFLSELLNASVDNAKELILGAFNVGLINANSLMAMAIRGYDTVRALSFFQNPEILAAINDVYVRQSITPLLVGGQVIRGGRNKFGKPYTLVDAIHNQITRLQNEPVIPVTAERIAELENILSEADIEEYQEAKESGSFRAGANLDLDQIALELSKLKQDLPNAMNEAAAYRSKQIKNLQEFLDHVYLGEQIRRMNNILSLNVNGIPVFDYELDKMIEDIEFSLNQSLEDYLSGKKQKNTEWYLSKKSFLSPEELSEEKAKEKAIRKFINIGAVIDTLPHIKEYLNTLYTIREFYSGSVDNKGNFNIGFLRNSPLVKEIFNRFFESKKINFPSEKKYYAFYNQLEKFFIALYFNQKHQTAILPSTTSLITGSEMINISTPEGRYRYGMEFPQFVSNLIDEIKSNDEMKDHVGNKFLNRLSYDKNDTIGPILELRDGASINEQQKADIISDFNKLDQIQPGLKEKFALYHLMKDGFVFRQNSIGQVMDSSIFAGFNSFLDELSVYAMQDANEKETYLDLGNGKSASLFDILDNVFLADVATYETDLLDYYNDSWTEDTRPDQYKEGKRYGIYNSIGMVKSDNPQVIYKGKFLDRFNPYNPAESTITSGQTFKRMSYEKYKEFKKGHNVVIKNANARGYSNGAAFLSDGTVVDLLIDKKKNQITIKHKNSNIAYSIDEEEVAYNERLKRVNYSLKTVAILTSERGKAIIEKGKKNNWSIDKILQEAQVPKEQVELLKQQEGDTIEDKLVNFIANYSQVIEINVATHEKHKVGQVLTDEYGQEFTVTQDMLNSRSVQAGDPTQIYKNLTAHGNTREEIEKNRQRELEELDKLFNKNNYYKNNSNYKQYNNDNLFNEFANLKGYNTKDVLNTVKNKTEDEHLKRVIDVLITNSSKIDNIIKFNGVENFSWTKTALARFNPNEGIIALNKNAKNIWSETEILEGIVHEYIHAYTVKALESRKTVEEKQFYNDIISIFQELKNNTINKKAYGFTNIKEFVSEILSNSEFRNSLKQEKIGIFKKIINAVLNLFGIKTNNISDRNLKNIEKAFDVILNFIPKSNPSLAIGRNYYQDKTYEEQKIKINAKYDKALQNLSERPYIEGDWEYKELRIQVPNMKLNDAARKHEPFSTGDDIAHIRASFNNKTGEVVIHEMQSDPFQDNVKKTFENENSAKDYAEQLKQTYNNVTIKKIQENGVDKWQVTGREKKQLALNKITNATDAFSNLGKKINYKESDNQFLQLLNQKDNWVKFITQSIIQQSAKQGFTTIKFPTGNTTVKIEGGSTIEEFRKEKEDRIKELEYRLDNKQNELRTAKLIDSDKRILERQIAKIPNQINRLKQELKTLEEQGLTGTFGGVFKFYETQLKNVLDKAGYNPKLVTDEYGNTWNEITIDLKRDLSDIIFSSSSEKGVINKMSKYFDNDKENLRKYFMSYDKREILRMIMNNSNLSHFRTLASILLNMPNNYILAKGNVRLMDTKTEYRFTVPNSNGQVANAFFELDSNNFYMNLDKIKSGLRYEATFLHELMHQLTLAVFRKDRNTMTANEIEFVDAITNLYNEAKNVLPQNVYYGLTNVGEFISEAFVNPEFQKALAGIESKMKGSPSFWDRFIDALTGFINRMFPEGAPVVPNSVLEKVIKITSDYVVGKVESINFGNDVSDIDVENKLKECL